MFKYPDYKQQPRGTVDKQARFSDFFSISVRYVFSIVITLAVLMVKFAFPQLSKDAPYLLALVPILISAYLAGFIGGIISTVICTSGVILFIYIFHINASVNNVQHLQTVVFFLQGIGASWLISRIKRDNETEYRQRQWYEVTLASIADAVIATDKHGSVIYMNGMAERLTGWRMKTAYAKPIASVFRIINARSRKESIGQIETALKGKQVVSMANHSVLLSKRGKEIPIDHSAAPIRGINNKIAGVIIVFHDVTQSRLAQEAIRRSEERLKRALQHTNIVAWGQDNDLRYTWIQNIQLPQLKREDIIGKTDRELGLVRREVIMKLDRAKRAAIKTKELQRLEINSGTDELPRYYDIIIQPIINDEGESDGVTCIAVNTTEHKLLDQKKDEFISIASHELRTPLTTIKGYIQILERVIKKSGDPRAQGYIEKTEIYIDRLNDLISELLDVSKIHAGKLPLHITSFDINALLRQTVENARMVYDKHAITFQTKGKIIVKGDMNRIEQVITNLLSNAVKYSPNADSIKIRSYVDGDSAILTVQDFGVGIPADKQSKLFKRFYRVEDTARHYSGLGIGLYISNEIILRHGGKMWVESEREKGSTFSFTLPL